MSDAALKILNERYFLKDDNGKIIEDWEGLCARVSSYIASVDDLYEKEFYDMLYNRLFLPNTPTLMNAGKKNMGGLHACFVIDIEDSMGNENLGHGITDSWKAAALIGKEGGGIGYPFSKLRPKGDLISTSKGTSSGPVSFMRVLDAVAEAVKQGGCFPGSTFVAAPGGPVQIKDVKAGTVVYAYDGNKLILSTTTDSWKTKQNAEIWKLTTDKGFVLYATPDHPILMRESGNGEKVYKKLKDLAVGNRIMPFTRYRKQIGGKKEWFLSIRDGHDTRVPEHRLVGSFLGFDAKNHFHHIDFNHENNHPSNLQELSHSKHAFLHGKIVGQRNDFRLLNLTPKERQKAINGYKETYVKLPEKEKERRRKACSSYTKKANQKRLELGSHNFTSNPPMKHRNILIDKMQVCISNNAYKIINSGGELSESKWEDQQKELGLYNLQRFKLETVNKYFGSWNNFIDYIDKNNHKVVSVEFSHHEDVYNVEVPGPHNYVICNKEMTTGIFVSNTRRIAQMGIMSVHHPDILEFIKCKNEEGQIKNFNISVAITDKFMEAVKLGKDYELINPATKKVVAKVPAKPIWDEIVAGAWLNGEPGVVFIDTINKYHNLKKAGQIWSTNPCLFKDTLIVNNNRLVQISSNDYVGNAWKTGIKRCIKVTTNAGHEIILTPDHKVRLADKSFVNADNSLGCELEWSDGRIKATKTINRKNVLMGYLFGDGFLCGEKQGISVKINPQKESEVAVLLLENGFHSQKSGAFYTNKDDINIKHAFLYKRLPERTIPSDFFSEFSADDWRDFLIGLFEANGSCNVAGQISLKTTCKELANQVQIILGAFGIKSWICKNKEQTIKWKNGQYRSRESYNLQIAPRNGYIFKDRIGFLSNYKNDKIRKMDIPYNGKLIVTKIEDAGELEVWDFTNECHYEYANGIIAHNCSEQPLLPYEACVLGSIDVGKLVYDKVFNWDELKRLVRLSVRFLDNTVTLSNAPISEINETVAKNRKIGLGIMGFADCLIQLGISYGSEKSFEFAEELAKTIKETAHEASVELGKERGIPENVEKYYQNTTPGTPNLKGMPRNACQVSYAPTGCQRGDTLVVSNNGILKLNEIGNKIGDQWQDINIEVSQEYGYKKASKFFINGKAKTKKIKMSSGAELECTLNHKYRVLTDNYEWKQASEIIRGDKIVLSLGTYNKTTEVEFKKIDRSHFNEHNIIQPDKSTPILAKFLGIYYGDGSNHDKGIRIACNAKETDYLKVVQMSKDIFGIEPTLENNGRNCISVCLNSQQLLKWLEINGLKKGKSVDIEVPMLVRQFSRDSLVQFVNGFFFADGSFGKNNKYFDTASTKFARQMLTIIRAIGLDCSIQHHISGKGSFINRVLFNSRRRTCHAKHSFLLQEEGFYNCVVDDVVEIEDSECETFDIEVLDRNTYLANGYISHNTIASIADASFGIEPLYDVCFIKNILDGKQVFFVSDIVAQYLKSMGHDKVVKEIESGKLLKDVDIPKEIKELFVTAYSLKPEQHVRMQASFQKYCDSAISKTCNLPNAATKEDVANVYLLSYDLGCKGITVYRDGSRIKQVVEVGKGKRETAKVVKRPEVVQGVTYKIPTSFGKLYMTVNRDGDIPIEVFFSMADISNDMSSLLAALGRILSVSLKHGTPIKDIIKTLKKIKVGTVVYYNGKMFKSVPQLVAGVLEEVFLGAKEQATLVAMCDKCGAQLIVQEGCEKCSNPECNYTKCG